MDALAPNVNPQALTQRKWLAIALGYDRAAGVANPEKLAVMSVFKETYTKLASLRLTSEEQESGANAGMGALRNQNAAMMGAMMAATLADKTDFGLSRQLLGVDSRFSVAKSLDAGSVQTRP